MSDFDPHITIEEQKDAADVNCVVKNLTIDTHRMKIETPVKVLSGNSISNKTADSLLPDNTQNPFFEFTKYYSVPKYYANLKNILENGGESKDWTETLDASIYLRKGLQNKFRKNVTISTVFRYYPLNDVNIRNTNISYDRMTQDLYLNFLDYVYGISTGFILTPDVYLTTSQTRQISVKEYLDFIAFSVEALERRNRKPIFVPIQIDLASKDLNQVLAFYKDHGFSNIWINFKAKACNGSSSGKLRTISRLIEDEYFGKDAVIYCSQMKRERDVKSNSFPSLDILPPFISADFLGINRTNQAYGVDTELTAKRKGFSSAEEYKKAQELTKQSIFNADTYKYCLPSFYPKNKIKERILAEASKNVTNTDFFNGILIDRELDVIKEKIRNDEHLLPYLQSKEGVKENMSVFGNASKDIKTPGRTTDLLDFF